MALGKGKSKERRNSVRACHLSGIRQHDRARETPIIFLSAIHTETHYARQGLSLGAVDYIYKPFDPDLLRDKVRSFVTLHR